MIGLLRVLSFFVGASLGITTLAGHVEGHQLNTANRECGCTCRPIDGITPWIFEDLAVTLRPGEIIAKKYAWFTGTIVCLRPEEDQVRQRFAEIQRIVDDGARYRIERYREGMN